MSRHCIEWDILSAMSGLVLPRLGCFQWPSYCYLQLMNEEACVLLLPSRLDRQVVLTRIAGRPRRNSVRR
jgi:hypothetical protein